MPSKLGVFSVSHQDTSKYDIVSSRQSLIILFILTASYFESVAGGWSIKAMDRLKEQKAAMSSSSAGVDEEFKYKVAVFYGTHRQRRQNRECEKLKCEFISTGCLVTDQDPPPPFMCYTIWSEMCLPHVGDCPYKPCESYNQKSTCVSDEKSCIQGQGELVPFGLCKDSKQCCLIPGNP